MYTNKNEHVSTHVLYARSYINRFYSEHIKKLLPVQTEKIVEFDRVNQANDLSELTRRAYLRELFFLAKKINKPFEEMTKEELMDFLSEMSGRLRPHTVWKTKRVFKTFFKFVYKTDECPDVVRWMKSGISNRHREATIKIITDEERKRLLQACKNQRDRAMLTFLDQTGCRASEMTMTRIGDISTSGNENYITITLGQGKTGRRRIIITEGISEIILWLNMHPLKHDPNAPLFVCFSDNHKYKKLGGSGLTNIFTRIKDNARIERRIYPHLFRHTRATIAGKVWNWNEARMRVFFGWTKTSPMPSLYTHINDEDVIELSLIEAGLKNKKESQTSEIKDRECPRCKKKNPFDSKFCNFCSLILDQEMAARNAKVVKITDAIMDISQEQEIPMPEAVKKYIDLKLKELNGKN